MLKQNYLKILYMATLMAFISLSIGCGTKSITAQDNYSVSKDGYGRYGNFCGKGYPYSGKSDPEEDLKFLADIEPYDLLDKACKIHDMCYDETPNNHKLCDDQLTHNLDLIEKNMTSQECQALWATVYDFSSSNNNNFLKAIRSPFFVVGGVLSTLSEAIIKFKGQKIECGRLSSYKKPMYGEEIISKYKTNYTTAKK